MEVTFRELLQGGGASVLGQMPVELTETIATALSRLQRPSHAWAVVRKGAELHADLTFEAAGFKHLHVVDISMRPSAVSGAGGGASANPYQTTLPVQHQHSASAPQAGSLTGPMESYQTPKRSTIEQFTYSDSSRKEPLRGGGATSGAQGGFSPISELTQYSGGRWKIKARVITKSDIRRFSNARGEGQFFKVDLKDQSGEVGAAFFGKACEKFYNVLAPGQVFTFAKGMVKAANPRFDKGNVALSFEEYSIIEAIADDVAVPTMEYDWKTISDLAMMPVNSVVDLKVVIYNVNDIHTFTSKNTNREMTKREIGLWDPSGPDGSATVDVTLWGDRVHGTFEVGSVAFIKEARVSEWQNAKSLNSPAAMDINPDKPEAFDLRAKYEQRQLTSPLVARRQGGGGAGRRQSLAEVKTEDLQLGVGPEPGQPFDPNVRSVFRHSFMATITTVPTDRLPCYPSCPAMVEATNRPGEQRSCQKKTQDEGGVWRCAFGHSCEAPVWRYICRVSVMDHTEMMEINVFDKDGKSLFGVDADEFTRIWNEEGGPDELNRGAMWRRLVFTTRSSKEVWQDVERNKCSVESISVVDWAKEGKTLLSEINSSLGTGVQAVG